MSNDDSDNLQDDSPDDVTMPARQGEVPDWFATSEDSEPFVVPEPAEPEVQPEKPAEVSAEVSEEDSAPVVPAELPPEVPPAVEPAAAETAVENAVEPSALPVGTRRRARPKDVPGEPPGTRRRPPIPPPPPLPQTARGYGCADVITSIFLLLTVLVASVTILLIANPQSPLNPFPAKTFPAVMIIPTDLPTDLPTGTFTPEPATPTPLPSMTFTALPTATPTATATPTQTPVIGAGSPASGGNGTSESTAPAPEATSASGSSAPQYTLSPFPFTVKPLQYTANKTSEGCSWQSIAGSVVDTSGKPIKGIAIHVAGSNGNIDEMHYSGTEARFGEGGFEVFLGTIPRDDQYTIQLLGRTGNPISDTVNVATRTGCEGNVVIVNFVQNHPY